MPNFKVKRAIGTVLAGALMTVATAAPSLAAPKVKVAICHKPGTASEQNKNVSAKSLKGHQGHGDTLGACVVVTPPLPA